MSLVRLLFSFQGRILRSQWWLAQIGVVLFIVVAATGIATLGAALGNDGPVDPNEPQSQAFGPVFGLIVLAAIPVILWVNCAVTAKRWHDRDKSAAMVLIALIPVVGGLWTTIECGFLPGSPGTNRYGPSPMDPGEQARAFA